MTSAPEMLGAATAGPLRLEELQHCFQGIAPAVISTCSRDGEPNVTYLSQVFYVSPTRVALSCQFFNKTRRNVAENPYASITLHDPITFDAYKLRLRYLMSETEGPIFETMKARIQVIASHTGMAGVFRLIAADHYEVLAAHRFEGYMLPPDPVLDAESPTAEQGPLTELRGLQVVSERISHAEDLDDLLRTALLTLDELLGFSHAMVLLLADDGRLVTAAGRGYGEAGLGSSVAVGEGLIGTVAQSRRMVRVAGFGAELRYGRAIRGRVQECAPDAPLSPEVPLPGLPDAQVQLGLPLLVCNRLLGVIAFESRDPLCFDEWDEAFLQVVANQIGLAIDRLRAHTGSRNAERAGASGLPTRRFVYYASDDCVFVDGHYLVRNLPGRILWKLLRQHEREGRTEFTNRELRLDPTLGLPPVKDNLESRLILLRRRLEEKCPELSMVPVDRGRFALQLRCAPELEEVDGRAVG